MRLYRFGPEGFFVATDAEGAPRVLHSDPFEDRPGGWRLGRRVDFETAALLAPVVPGKIVGIGRNYVEHALELDNPVPAEPVLFLKSPSSVVGPRAPIVLPPESDRVEYEGEVAVVLRQTLRRASHEQVRAAILGLTCACDVTARDLQKRDPTFARAKSFDTFCPLGPAIDVEPDLDAFTVITRVNGEERQRGRAEQMSFGILDLLVYTSRMMTLEAGDVVLTGTPAGVGRLEAGDLLEIEVSGVGVLENPVEAWQGG
ncbi:MAG: fumarylacetoacetate hydrolase family protein [Thermoanaerobaculia bacterium]|nr:fumarylacetoacetate hydrolase family protein [Thermoanaerobaculia bacterium]